MMRTFSFLTAAVVACSLFSGCRSGASAPSPSATMNPAYRLPMAPSYDSDSRPSAPSYVPSSVPPVPPVPGIEATPDLSIPPAPPGANAPRRLPLGSASWKQPFGKMKASFTSVAAKLKPNHAKAGDFANSRPQAELAGSIDEPEVDLNEEQPLPELIAPARRPRSLEPVSGVEPMSKGISQPEFNRRPVPLPTSPVIQPAPQFPAIPEAAPVLQPVPHLPSFAIPPVEQTTHRQEADLPVIAPGATGFSRPRSTPPLTLGGN